MIQRMEVMQTRSPRGFTLVELCVLIAFVAIFGAFAAVAFIGMDEVRDATAVESVQSNLQAIISQASTRLDVPIQQFDPSNSQANAQNVVNAVNSRLGGGITLTRNGDTYTMGITGSGRSASFDVNTNGDVIITNLSGFQKYTEQNGYLQKQ